MQGFNGVSAVATALLACVLLIGCTSQQAWDKAQSDGSREAYLAYVQGSGKGPPPKHWKEAYRQIAILDWAETQNADTLDAYNDFVERYDSPWSIEYAKQELEAARLELPRLRLEVMIAYGNRRGLEDFVRSYHSANDQRALVARAKAAIAADDADWAKAVRLSTLESTQDYLAAHPYGKFVDKAESRLLMQQAARHSTYCLRVRLTGDFKPGQDEVVLTRVRDFLAPQGRAIVHASSCKNVSPVELSVNAQATSIKHTYSGDVDGVRRSFDRYSSVEIVGEIVLALEDREVRQSFRGATQPITNLYAIQPGTRSSWNGDVLDQADGFESWFHEWNSVTLGVGTTIAKVVEQISLCNHRPFGVSPIETSLARLGLATIDVILEYDDPCLWAEPGGHYESPLRHILVLAAQEDPESTVQQITRAIDSWVHDSAKQATLIRTIADIEDAWSDGDDGRPDFYETLRYAFGTNDTLAALSVDTLCARQHGQERVRQIASSMATGGQSSPGASQCSNHLTDWRRLPMEQRLKLVK